ncbi:hypothetical protein EBR66_00500 [bacterium]|nr:hypothetical protein [bacterium]
MRNVTIPLPKDLLAYLDEQVASHQADTRAGLIRRIIAQHRENELVTVWRQAQEERRAGKTVRGNLRDILKVFPTE